MTRLPPERDDHRLDLHVRVLETVVGGRVERSALVHALREARTAWPGTEKSLWWKWTTEAVASLGRRAKTFDGSVRQIESLVRRGTRILVRGPEQGWLFLTGTGWRGLCVVDPDTGAQRWMGRGQLARALGYTDPDDIVRGIAVESPAIESAVVESRSPFRRLFAILASERSDLWIVFVFALVAGVLSLATPIAVEALVNTVAFGRFLQPVVVLALLLFGFLAFGAAMRALQTFVVEIVQRRLFARTVSDLVHRLPRARHEQFDNAYGPEMANRFLDVVTVQKVIAQLLIDGVAILMVTVVGMAVLAFYHPWLLGFDVVLLFLIAFIVLVLGRGAVKSSVKESKNKYRMTSWLQDVVRCRTAFALDGAAEFAADRADHLTTDYLEARRKHFRILMRQILFALGMQAIAGTVLLGIGGWLVIQGELTLGQLVAAEMIVTTIVGSFAKLGKHMESYYDLLASVDKLGTLFDLRIEDQEGVLVVPHDGPARLSVRHLGYAYDGGRRVLDELEFDVEPGTTLAVLGPAGSGKSTLGELLFGLRQPSCGYVELDGVDPRDVRPDVLRGHVALAGRHEFFHGDIDENVRLDRPHVGPVDLRSALREVGLLDELLALPDGLKTQVTPTGAPLSEGQQRRLVLARAIAGSPRLLVVDGLLDGLGDDEAAEVLASIHGRSDERTTVVLTARRQVAERCDAVVEIGRTIPGAALERVPAHAEEVNR